MKLNELRFVDTLPFTAGPRNILTPYFRCKMREEDPSPPRCAGVKGVKVQATTASARCTHSSRRRCSAMVKKWEHISGCKYDD